jgi:hypothetical protein
MHRRSFVAGEKVVVTASLDKTIAAWRLTPNVVGACVGASVHGVGRTRTHYAPSLQPLRWFPPTHAADVRCAQTPPASRPGGLTVRVRVLRSCLRLQDEDEDAAPGDATGAGPPLRPFYCEVQKIAAPGGPVFSIAPARSQFDQPLRPKTLDGRPPANAIYCGTSGKDVVSWQPLMPAFIPTFRLDGHSGWVRAVATYDRYLFSAGGSFLRQFDCTYTKPKEVSTTEVSSDIVAITAGGGNVYAAGSDGSLWAWSIDRSSGQLSLTAAVEGAHKGGRIVGLRRHRGCVTHSLNH